MAQPIYLVEGLRTPIGAFLGSLSDVPAPALGARVISALVSQSGVSPSKVDQVIMGCVLSAGLGQAPARQAMRQAGLPDTTAALTINKVCGSGLMAVFLARQAILAEEAELVVAGGMENMSQAPYLLPGVRKGMKFGNQALQDALIQDGLWDPYYQQHMGEATEVCVSAAQLSRQVQDDFAIESYRRARFAIESKAFEDEIVPIDTTQGRANRPADYCQQDEQPFKDNLEKLASLKPAFVKPNGTITAGNASTLNDGAAALLVASEKALASYGLVAKAKILATATFSQDPQQFATAPIGAIERVLNKARLSVADIDLFEINEAFAAVTLLAMQALDIPYDKVNVFGGAVSLGHPIGASGARILVTLMSALKQRNLKTGLATLCIGGGEAVAIVIERV
ncbi:MAG: thiolase family protein [Vampirovibrionales bacterium]|nr:thiolase family protein [Vampirovibrionales bacterium]